jgi:hypothetical protein
MVMLAKAAGKSALTFMLTGGASLLKAQQADSLVKLTEVSRVEPITMIDRKLTPLPYLNDTLHSLVSLFSAYFLQAAALTLNIKSVNTLSRLEQLNPNRTQGRLLQITGLGLESEQIEPSFYRFGLPRRNRSFGLEAFGMDERQTRSALEAFYETDGASVLPDLASGADGERGVKFGKDAVADLVQTAPLSVGKMLEVTLTDGDKQLTLPVSVRLLSTIVDSSVLAHILSDGTKNITWKERWHAWRAGELELWRDLVLATDLVDEHRAALLKDKSGAYAEILARRRGNVTQSVLTARPSLATASNLMVASTTTIRDVERALHGKISDPMLRDKIFKMTYLMILAVIDPDNEMVTFYHRGIAMPTTVSIRELKVTSKGNGQDVGEILQKLMLGKPPVL